MYDIHPLQETIHSPNITHLYNAPQHDDSTQIGLWRALMLAMVTLTLVLALATLLYIGNTFSNKTLQHFNNGWLLPYILDLFYVPLLFLFLVDLPSLHLNYFDVVFGCVVLVLFPYSFIYNLL